MLPLVLLCVISVVGITAVCTERLRLAEVARLCARVASTADDPVGTARRIADDNGALAVAGVDPTATFLTVTVRSATLPLVPGFVSRRVPLAATTVIAIERSPVLG